MESSHVEYCMHVMNIICPDVRVSVRPWAVRVQQLNSIVITRVSGTSSLSHLGRNSRGPSFHKT